ncbi:T3SS effector OspC family protein [Endozoicomonas ascidiicola]|uniref:T3SS effector OspC family protein n=1 Tax=Endozoicomonas ascidiicola TaxID=1698521 RepID=UPI000836E988|nr:T3SS effector OspC family protein [Endozoicomonas ascidiicola]
MDCVSGVSSESLPLSGGRLTQFRKAMGEFGNRAVYKITGKRKATFENASSEPKFNKHSVDIKDRGSEIFYHLESGSSIDPKKIYSGEKEDRAARVIQKAVTNWLDKKTLKNDFKYLGLPENMKGTAFGNLRAQSAMNLEKIRIELGELTDDEKNILSIIRSVKMRFRHQTGIRLDKARLIMMSPSLRQAEGRHRNHYHNNYVFFSVEFAHEFSNEEPLKTKQTSVDQGPIAYLLSKKEVDSRPCLITLCDSYTGSVLYCSFCSGFPTPREETRGYYKFYDKRIFFIPDHLLSAMALYLIQDVRKFRKSTPSYASMIVEKIYDSSSENNNVQEVLNSLMEPEAKVPRMLKSSDFCKKQFRRYSVSEARRFKKMDELLSYLNNKDDCVGMLAEILEGEYAKEKCMEPVFKKIFSMVGRDDLLAIKEAYAKISKWSKPGKPADLANYLCYEWNDDNRELSS